MGSGARGVEDVEAWLELIVFGVISIAVWETLRAAAKSDPVMSRIGSIGSVQRITWDHIKTRGEDIKPGTAFAFSFDVFRQIPPELFEDDAKGELRRIQGWLKEDAFTSAAEEIYLVARERRLSGKIRGVLYATLDKGLRAEGPSSCMVWHLAVDQALRDDLRARLDVCAKLWERLEEIVGQTSPDTNTYRYFVEIPKRTANPSPRLDEHLGVLTTFLARRPVSMSSGRTSQMRMMDIDYKAPDGASAILLYAGEKEPLPAEETLDLLYGMHFWGFTYGIEVKTLGELRDRAAKYAHLKAGVLKSCVGGAIPLVAMSSTAAQSRGLTWPRLEA
jgi:hypothetical protein